MSYNQDMFNFQLLRRPVAMMAAEVDLHFASGAGTPREAGREPHVAIQEAEPEIRRPPLFKVVLNNDDYTPMAFVIEVLQTIFGINRNKAVQIMLYVHTRGKGVAGVFTYEIAETKAAQVNEYARQHQHPLLCTLEAV